MPFTPFHLGPGLAVKAVAGRHFSLLTFGIAQVAMDIEPLIGMIRGSDVLHGVTHTYLAATFIALPVALIAPPICRPILQRWHRELAHYRLPWLAAPAPLSRVAVITGALAGTLSHVALDSFMHADMAPLAPWVQSNGLLHVISTGAVYQGCAVAGLLGLLGWAIAGWCRRKVE